MLGRDVRYRQLTMKELLQQRASSQSPAAGRVNARTVRGTGAAATGRTPGVVLLQHMREVALDYQAGIFAGTNDVIETIGGRPPLSLEAFFEKHRKAFE